MENINIQLIDFGVGYRTGNNIEINRRLLNYPNLYKEVLDHEMKHNTDSLVDLWHDFKALSNFNLEWLKFSIQNPKAVFQSALPVWKIKEGWCINSFLCFFYSATILLTTGGYYLMRGVL